MTDLLKQSAEAYKRLSVYRYTFTLGRRGKTYTLILEFPEASFWHLSGLHRTRTEAVKVKKNALQAVLNGEVTVSPTENPDIISRWQGICDLQMLLESNNAVFKYRGHEFYGSYIRAEYLISDQQTMFFIDGDSPVSIFSPTPDQLVQMRNCPKLTTLKIERETIASGEKQTLYVSPSYKENSETTA